MSKLNWKHNKGNWAAPILATIEPNWENSTSIDCSWIRHKRNTIKYGKRAKLIRDRKSRAYFKLSRVFATPTIIHNYYWRVLWHVCITPGCNRGIKWGLVQLIQNQQKYSYPLGKPALVWYLVIMKVTLSSDIWERIWWSFLDSLDLSHCILLQLLRLSKNVFNVVAPDEWILFADQFRFAISLFTVHSKKISSHWDVSYNRYTE